MSGIALGSCSAFHSEKLSHLALCVLLIVIACTDLWFCRKKLVSFNLLLLS